MQTICLIKPPSLHKGISFARMATPPLGLAIIASAIQSKGYNIQIIDSTGEKPNQFYSFNGFSAHGLDFEEIASKIDSKTNIFCVSLMFSSNWLLDRELISFLKIKFPNCSFIGGGEHATALPEICIESGLDYIVLGEGDSTIIELIKALEMNLSVDSIDGIVYKKNNNYVRTQPKKRIQQIDSLPFVDWDLFPVKNYFLHEMTYGVAIGKTLPILASRGCPYECTFCSSPQMWGRNYYVNDVNLIVNLMETYNAKYGVTNFDFYDLTALIKRDWIIDLCKEIINRKLNITFQLPSGTRSEAIDNEVAKYLFQSGCRFVSYAPESGSVKVLRETKKKVKIKSMLKSINQSNKAGLNVKLNMILGFPHDTHRDIWLTFWFLIKCSWHGANDAAPAIFSPYPGTQLYKELLEKKWVNPNEDSYYEDLLNSYDIIPNKTYCFNISKNWLRVYIFIFLLFFYGSNYLFRPWRFFKLITNVMRKKQTSRLEQLIITNLFRPMKYKFLRLVKSKA